MDDYNTKKANLEKELVCMKEDLPKREEFVNEKEKLLTDLQTKVAQFPADIAQAVTAAEEQLRTQLMQQHDFESQLAQKELEGLTKLNNLQITSLQGKIKEQEALIKEMSQKSEQAAENVQKIACRALDTSSQRFMAMPASSTGSEDRVVNFQK
jgi:predicted AAA+ superfamily ATPase